MPSENSVVRPAPRWIHIWAIATVIATSALLALGGLVTTFRVGMADPVWPTEPWFLFFTSWSEPRPGFLIEHTHRLAGFLVGGFTAVLAIAVWHSTTRGISRWVGWIGLSVLLVAFGQFQGEMMKQIKSAEIVLPRQAIAMMAGSLAILLVISLGGRATGSRNAGLRTLVTFGLVAVMMQGLLGGFRVRLNAWAGADLAAVHGIFAQVVFSVLISIAVLTAAEPSREDIDRDERSRCKRIGAFLVGLVFLQLIWGALVRHNPTPLTQRLHLLTAFAVIACAVWAMKTASSSPTVKNRLRPARVVLSIFLLLQIVLGVEAWMGKFATGVLPELQKIETRQAVIRTAHMLIGTGILATSVAIVLLVRRRSVKWDGRTETVAEPHTRTGAERIPVMVAGSPQIGDAL